MTCESIFSLSDPHTTDPSHAPDVPRWSLSFSTCTSDHLPTSRPRASPHMLIAIASRLTKPRLISHHGKDLSQQRQSRDGTVTRDHCFLRARVNSVAVPTPPLVFRPFIQKQVLLLLSYPPYSPSPFPSTCFPSTLQFYYRYSLMLSLSRPCLLLCPRTALLSTLLLL